MSTINDIVILLKFVTRLHPYSFKQKIYINNYHMLKNKNLKLNLCLIRKKY